MLLPPPLPRNFPIGKYLCHRGVAGSVIQEIADVLRQDDPRLVVQEGDGLAVSFSEFRRLAIHHLQADCNDLVVLLSKDFSGPVYSQTFGSFGKWAIRDWCGRIIVIRVEDCEIANVVLSADLADVTNRARRRELIIESLGRPRRGAAELLELEWKFYNRQDLIGRELNWLHPSSFVKNLGYTRVRLRVGALCTRQLHGFCAIPISSRYQALTRYGRLARIAP